MIAAKMPIAVLWPGSDLSVEAWATRFETKKLAIDVYVAGWHTRPGMPWSVQSGGAVKLLKAGMTAAWSARRQEASRVVST